MFKNGQKHVCSRSWNNFTFWLCKSSTQENFEQQFTIAQGALNHLDSNYKR